MKLRGWISLLRKRKKNKRGERIRGVIYGYSVRVSSSFGESREEEEKLGV